MWVIGVPAWGKRYVEHFLAVGLPRLLEAVDFAGVEARYVVHTDRPGDLEAAFAGRAVTFPPVPDGKLYVAFGRAHAEALESAAEGDVFVPLCCDIALSPESLVTAARMLAGGKRAVLTTGLRTAGLPPRFETAAELGRWAIANMHYLQHESLWGANRMTPSSLLFAAPGSLVFRAFHLHPVAMVKKAGAVMTSTCDEGLPGLFEPDEIVVAGPREGIGFMECSPPDKDGGVADKPYGVEAIAAWAARRTTPLQRWLFSQRLVLEGDGSDRTDVPVAEAILARIEALDPAWRRVA